MNTIGQLYLSALLQSEARLGSVITYKGKEYPCSGGAEMGGKALDIGGYEPACDVQVVLRTDAFASISARPIEKSVVIYTSSPEAVPKTLRIDSINIFFDAVMVLDCVDINTGA